MGKEDNSTVPKVQVGVVIREEVGEEDDEGGVEGEGDCQHDRFVQVMKFDEGG